MIGGSCYHVWLMTGGSCYHVWLTTGGSCYHVWLTTGGSCYHVWLMTGGSYYHVWLTPLMYLVLKLNTSVLRQPSRPLPAVRLFLASSSPVQPLPHLNNASTSTHTSNGRKRHQQICKTTIATRLEAVENDASARSPNLSLASCHLLTHKADRYMSLPHKPFLPISIKIGSFVFKTLCSHVRGTENTDQV